MRLTKAQCQRSVVIQLTTIWKLPARENRARTIFSQIFANGNFKGEGGGENA